jgi:hypothetical protein
VGSGRDDVRIGDTERNEARALLDIHLAEGRLSLGEHEQRCVVAGAARFVGELDNLFSDLPAPHPEPDAGLRIGDTERNEARALLDIHLAEGRLSFGEHEERCMRAGAARVKLDVSDLFADLPAPHPDLSGVVRPSQPEPKEVVAVTADPEPTPKPKSSPASNAFGVMAFLAFVAGLPTTIVVTIAWGAWWTILANVFFGIVSVGASMALEKPDPPPQGTAT